MAKIGEAAGLASSIFLVITFATLTVGLMWLLIVAYRLQFHPLSRFPGPLLAKISDLYPAWYSIKGELHLKIQDAHQKYGPIVRIGPNKLAVNSVTGLEEIYRKDHVQKSKGYETMIPAPGAYNTHTCIDKALHRRKRKVVNQAFSEHAIRAFEPIMLRHIEIFVDGILRHCQLDSSADGWSKPLDMSRVAKYLSLDVMGEFGFGRAFEMQTKEANRFLIQAIQASSKVAGAYAQYPRLKQIKAERWVKQGTWTRAKFGELMKNMVQQRIAEDTDASPDLFSLIINAKDPETGKGFALDEIWAESRLFIIAGSDTTATALAAAFFYLSRNTECKTKLVTLIRETFSSTDEICIGPKLTSCHFLGACIDEAMRMSPPVGTPLWREVCKEGIVIDGEYIPAGVEVGSSLYSIHHLGDVFEDPWNYDPERWMEAKSNTSEARKRMQRLAFNPFSLGSRKCAAQTMAYTEVSITLAKTLWRFDFRVPAGPLGMIGAGVEGDRKGRHRVGEYQIREHLTSHHDGPFLEFRPREY